MKLIPNNWHDFQHYKHRNPPWIKFHKKLLDNMTFQRLPVASRAIAPMLWLLASESENGLIEKSTEEIAFRLRMAEKDVLTAIKPLIDNGFFNDADNVLASCLQDATTETEKSRDRVDTPDGVSESIFKDYLEVRKTKKAKWTGTALKGLQREASKANISLEKAMQICCERNWVGIKAEWVKDEVVQKQPWEGSK
jgi:hypothetical protein